MQSKSEWEKQLQLRREVERFLEIYDAVESKPDAELFAEAQSLVRGWLAEISNEARMDMEVERRDDPRIKVRLVWGDEPAFYWSPVDKEEFQPADSAPSEYQAMLLSAMGLLTTQAISLDASRFPTFVGAFFD